MASPGSLPQQSPRQWGAQVQYDDWTPTRKDGVTVHYVGNHEVQRELLSAHVRCTDRVRAIERYHMAPKPHGNDWNGIGYSYVICPHGTLYRGRGEARGAHNPGDSDGDGTPDNIDSYGVLMLVGGDEQPAPAALQMLQRVVDTVGGTLAPHSADRATPCPGDPLRRWINAYQRDDQEDDDMRKPSEWAKAVWEKARKRGLVKAETDPHDTLTKEELMAFFDRLGLLDR